MITVNKPQAKFEESDLDQESRISGHYTAGELLNTVFIEPELVMYSLRRGQLGIVNAKPSAGKTTLMLNAAIALCCGDTFEPLVPEALAGTPRRVLYLDLEGIEYTLRADLLLMTQSLSPERQQMVEHNLNLIVEGEIDDEPIDLSNPMHMAEIARVAMRHKADLIVVDTLAEAAQLYDENSNAEVQRKVLRPSKKLRKLTGAAVVFVHHKGKKGSEEGSDQAMYAGRGASATACSARLIINLDRDSKAQDVIHVTNPKDKVGKPFPDTLMKRGADRWFRAIGHETAPTKTNYSEVVELVRAEGQPMRTAQIIERLSVTMSKPTIERALSDALERHELKSTKRGWYEAVDTKEER